MDGIIYECRGKGMMVGIRDGCMHTWTYDWIDR